MIVKVLGSGSAYGCPNCFNRWGDIKDRENKKNHRSRSSILLETGNWKILIDIGPDFRSQINDNGIDDIDALFITHGHYDHTASLPELPRAAKALKKNIPVYCAKETMDGLKKEYHYLFREDSCADKGGVIWNTIEHGKEFEYAGIKFIPFGVPHHNLQTTCFRTGGFAYVTDWQSFPEENKRYLQNLDLLLIECNNFNDDTANGHSNLPQVMELVSSLSPKQTILTHLSTRYDYEEASSALPPDMLLAYDGMVLSI